MVWSKPFTAEEDDYIIAVFPQMRTGKIAENLGRSPSGVRKRISELGLREKPATTPARVMAGEAPASNAGAGKLDLLAELYRVKEILLSRLLNAEPKNIASISSEYRKVCEQISDMEGGGDGSASKPANDLAGLIGFVPVRPA